MTERQVTNAAHGHVLTNTAVWSRDGHWIIYDVRSDPAGSVFDGTRIECVQVESGEVQVLYESRHGACCGVATFSPVDDRVVFILGPEHPTPEWNYGFARRQGVIWDNGTVSNLDARDLVPPFTPGALQGGTHLHTFAPDGRAVAFTYDDHLRPEWGRNVGVCEPGAVSVPPKHSRNHSGTHTARLLTRTMPEPTPGSDEYRRASEEGWIDARTIAFQGEVVTGTGEVIRELFVVPLDGVPRRITHTADRKYPGLQGPRHWPRVGPDGRVAMLMRDDDGVVQLFMVGNLPHVTQLTRDPHGVESAFSWVGRWIAHVRQGRVCVTDAGIGATHYLTEEGGARPEACVLSPDGSRVAFVRTVDGLNQVFCVGVGRP